MKKFIISEEVLNAVLTYLSSKPYIETYRLIEAIQNNPQPVEDTPKAEKKEDGQ